MFASVMEESTKIRVAKKYWWFIRRLCRLVGFKGLSKRGGRNIDIGGRNIFFLNILIDFMYFMHARFRPHNYPSHSILPAVAQFGLAKGTFDFFMSPLSAASYAC